MKPLHIVHLYPEEMNIYGDTGNRTVLEKRLQWREIPYKITRVGIGDHLPNDADIILGGGGQDAGQQQIEADLADKATDLQKMANDGVVMLMICGLYQLFGTSFTTAEGTVINGAGILPLYTQAGNIRLIGNVVIETEWGNLVGYENHSGRTWLSEGCGPFGRVLQGSGNNGEDQQEGARHKNVFGSYMHGPILSKNPSLADHLILLALQRHGFEGALVPLDDKLELAAAANAIKRPR